MKAKKERYRERFGAEAEAVRRMQCKIAGREGHQCRYSRSYVDDEEVRYSDPAHVRSIGAGGGRFDIVPLCNDAHGEQHSSGIETFCRKWAIDLRAVADTIALDHRGPELGLRSVFGKWGLNAPLTEYEREALVAWARRCMDPGRNGHVRRLAVEAVRWGMNHQDLADRVQGMIGHRTNALKGGPAWRLCVAAGWPT